MSLIYFHPESYPCVRQFFCLLCYMNQENQNVEHKRIWKDEYLKWVSGFANAHGGKIYIGIDDDMTVVGVDKLHQQLEDIPNKIINNTGVFSETNHLEMGGKDVIEIIITPSMMPISYRGVYYYRSGATKQELRGTALHQFLLKKMGLNWEDMPCDGTKLEDIDDAAINYFLDRAIYEGRMNPESRNSSKADVLENLGLINDGIPTNGAVLLFGKYPQRKFATSSFKIGRFGMDDADLLNQDEIMGNLIQMTDKEKRAFGNTKGCVARNYIQQHCTQTPDWHMESNEYL